MNVIMDPMKEAYKNRADGIIENLGKRNIEGYYCEDSKAAVSMALGFMEPGASVSWGGSETLKECGMMEALHSADFHLIDRKTAKSEEEQRRLYQEAAGADYFFMSTNAITLDGELVNIDGTGNRLAWLIHGPRHVIIMAGMNKVAANVDDAMSRIRNVASPANAIRLGYKTPCQSTGICSNCLSPDCMCCEVVITRKSRQDERIKVILIGEELGY